MQILEFGDSLSFIAAKMLEQLFFVVNDAFARRAELHNGASTSQLLGQNTGGLVVGRVATRVVAVLK